MLGMKAPSPNLPLNKKVAFNKNSRKLQGANCRDDMRNKTRLMRFGFLFASFLRASAFRCAACLPGLGVADITRKP